MENSVILGKDKQPTSINKQNNNDFKKQKNNKKMNYKISEFSSKIIKIINFLGEEEGYPISELLNNKTKRGWQSLKNCKYPQEIIFELEKTMNIKQIQFLFHQYKISSKIEILAEEIFENNIQYRHVGFFFPDSNEKSDYKARELKSVFIDLNSKKIKLIFHRNLKNMNNIFNQVGLIALNIFGNELIQKYESNSINIPENNELLLKSKQRKTSENITKNNEIIKLNNVYNKNNILKTEEIKSIEKNFKKIIPNVNSKNIKIKENIEIDQNLKEEKKNIPIFIDKIKYLNSIKEKAINDENYDKAKLISSYINKLKDISNKILILEGKKKIAVEKEDFELAKNLKNEINSLKFMAEFKVTENKSELKKLKREKEIQKSIKLNQIETENHQKNTKEEILNTNQNIHPPSLNLKLINKDKINGNGYLREKYIDELNNLLDSTRSEFINNLCHSVEIKPSNNQRINMTEKLNLKEKINTEKYSRQENNKTEIFKSLEDPNKKINITPKIISRNKKKFDNSINNILTQQKETIEDLIKSNEIKSKNNLKINQDERKIKGINKNFSEFVMEKLSTEPNIKTEDILLSSINDFDLNSEFNKTLDDNKINEAKPLYDLFSYNIIKMLFSKNWKIREKSIKLINQEIQEFPYLKTNKIFGTDTPHEIYFAVFYSVSYILASNFVPLTLDVLNLLKNCILKFKKEINLISVISSKNSKLNLITVKTLNFIIEKLADKNQKIKEKAELTILEFSYSPLIGDRLVIDNLIHGKFQIEKSNKFILARLNLINKIVNIFGIYTYSKNILIDKIINFATEAFKITNKEIKDSTTSLLITIYDLYENKEDFNKYLKNIDQNIKNLFSNRLFGNEKENLDENEISRGKIFEPQYNSNKISYYVTEYEKNSSSSILNNMPLSKNDLETLNDISNIKDNESIKIIINNNNYNYNYKNKNKNKNLDKLKFNLEKNKKNIIAKTEKNKISVINSSKNNNMISENSKIIKDREYSKGI